MSSFAKDLRTDTLSIGLLNALAWYFAYPVFLSFVATAVALADYLDVPILTIVAAPAVLLFLVLALMPAAFSGIVTYTLAFVVRNAWRYRLPTSSWRTFLHLAVAYSAICVIVFAAGTAVFPLELPDHRRELHQWLWPWGVGILCILLSIVSAAITFRLLRPAESASARH